MVEFCLFMMYLSVKIMPRSEVKMKKRYIMAASAWVVSIVLCLAMISIAISAEVEKKPITLAGEGQSDSDGSSKVVITLARSKPGIYTAIGTLYLGVSAEQFAIKGTFYENSGQLKATCRHPKHNYPAVVDGYIVKSDLYVTRMDVTIKDAPSGRIFFEGILSSEEKFPSEEEVPPDTLSTTGTVSGDDEVMIVDGVQPSPPDKPEKWEGQWRGMEKARQTIEKNPPVERDGPFEVTITREGSNIRAVMGKKSMLFTVNGKNPNIAAYKEQKKETLAIGWGDVVEKRTMYLRDGRLYAASKILVTSHTQLPGLPATVGHAENYASGKAERVK